MIYWLDCDLHGTDSVADLIDAGLVKHLPVASFPDFDKHVRFLLANGNAGDEVVCDTLTQLLDTTRNDATLGTDDDVDLWEKRTKYLATGGGDRDYLAKYNMAQGLVMRRLRNLANKGLLVRVICHQDELFDQSTVPPQKKLAPKVNPALLDILIGQSSDVFRLYALPEAITTKDGTVKYPADTRVLYLRRSEEHVAKYNVTWERSEKLPRYVVNPNFPRVETLLGKSPAWLTLYGPPGSGKTTFALSRARVELERGKQKLKNAQDQVTKGAK